MALGKSLVAVMALVCAAPALSDEPRETFAELQSAASEDPAAWYGAAQAARKAGDTDTAHAALERAREFGLSPIRAGFERARILVVDDNEAGAIAELKSLAEEGFTAVTAITSDPVLGILAGEAAFDAFIKALSVQAYPCDNQEKFREFDFWIGDWEVRSADGTLAGRNSIQPAERGCVLLENWAGAGGDTGMSLNYLDDASGEWVQIWSAASGTQIDIRGGMTDEGMLLSGEIHYIANGTTAAFRGLWTLLPDGRVRQFFEQSADGGETWSPWFEGFYSRSEATDQDL